MNPLLTPNIYEPEVPHYVAHEDCLYPISPGTIERSKTLRELESQR